MITVLTKLLGIALQHLLESKVPAHFAMVYDTTSQTVFCYQYLVRLDHRGSPSFDTDENNQQQKQQKHTTCKSHYQVV